MSIVAFLLPSLMACLVLTGIHTYLGIHVVARGVIFVDIALAQIAALGMTVAMLFGYEPESIGAYFFALGFTSLGAVFFSLFHNRKIPQEAMIGVSFAISSALSILIADALPHGAEHLKYLLSGNILWVTWPQIIKIAIIYSALGLFHFILRTPFFLLSFDRDTAIAKGMSTWRWDLLFYLSFGFVITSSVQIGGILLVFSFLIVPSLCSLLFCETLKNRLLLGWLIGAAVSLLGIAASYIWDWPTGPTIVSSFGVVLGLALLLAFITQLRNRVCN